MELKSCRSHAVTPKCFIPIKLLPVGNVKITELFIVVILELVIS